MSNQNNNEKLSTPFLDNLLGKPKVKSKYISVYALQSVACNNCKIAFAPNSAQFTETPELLQPIAEGLHKAASAQAKTLCGTPQLCITYSLAFMDSGAVEK